MIWLIEDSSSTVECGCFTSDIKDIESRYSKILLTLKPSTDIIAFTSPLMESIKMISASVVAISIGLGVWDYSIEEALTETIYSLI
jgi:hypothetical protein